MLPQNGADERRCFAEYRLAEFWELWKDRLVLSEFGQGVDPEPLLDHSDGLALVVLQKTPGLRPPFFGVEQQAVPGSVRQGSVRRGPHEQVRQLRGNFVAGQRGARPLWLAADFRHVQESC